MAKSNASKKVVNATKKVDTPPAKSTTAQATTKPVATKKTAVKSPATSEKYVYYFGGKKAEGDKNMKNILGGKGANLAEMVNIGIPVPPGFTISTDVCTYFYANKKQYPNSLKKQVEDAIAKLEKETKMIFGDKVNPLLVSVRSGSRASMPGMMDTILNLGLNDKTVESIAKKTNNPKFAYDSYRRFISMYGDVVLGLKPETKEDIDPFEEILEKMKKKLGIKLDVEFTANNLKKLCEEFKEIIKKKTKKAFPQDVKEQLWGAIGSVLNSWMNERAIVYRKMNEIPESWGTAVNIQSMVFGNMGDTSGTGVAFTRDPATGENYFYGEFLMNAQGEDVVAGTRTPEKIVELKNNDPDAYNQLIIFRKLLEKHYKDMMDIEFTIQEGKLYMLQCRVGKRTAMASMKMAVDMVNEGLIFPDEAIRRIDPATISQLLRPVFDATEKKKALADKNSFLTKGLNAGPGAASGKIVFNAEDAEMWNKKGDKVILVRIETSPEDIKGMEASEGILTARGGMTSHAALVARQMGKVCVAGCGALIIDYKAKTMKIDGKNIVVKQGDYISIDGDTGEVFKGEIKTQPSEVVEMLFNKKSNAKSETIQIYNKIMEWADAFRDINIRTNADQPDQAENAIAFGAEGIGLCRTEHMFFGEGKIEPMREMILAKTQDDRKKALLKLLPHQRKDFEGIFEAMNGRPVTIRTIDPPLHEFLPQNDKEQQKLAKEMGLTANTVKERVNELHEGNPMLGFRGCRLGLIFPEITEMQARAIFEATANVMKKKIKVSPEIMIPLVGNVKELKSQEEIVRRVADEVMKENKVKFDYLVGTMIEVPRGAITAAEIASVAEFFSFGTNDLTQTTLGVSRDDAGRFLPEYVSRDIYDSDPFVSIDRSGVGYLIELAVKEGRKTRPNIKLGICGEHGGDPSSIEFCYNAGLAYVSCSPFRVPIARVAAAKAILDDKSNAARHHVTTVRNELIAKIKKSPVTKPVVKEIVEKPVAKAPAEKPVAKAPAKPVAKAPVKPVAKASAKPVAKAPAKKPVVKTTEEPIVKKPAKPVAKTTEEPIIKKPRRKK